MCTLIAIHRRIPGAPLVIAANRDEYLDRPTEGPAVRDGAAGPLLAPRDVRAGGTWLGLGAHGVFAAVTNRRSTNADPKRASRGWVAMKALESPSAEAAAAQFAALPRAEYNPFNALAADGERAFTLIYDDAPIVRELEPGAHVVGNVDPDAEDVPKVARVMKRARAAAERPVDAAVEELADACREHEDGPASLDDTCVHLGGYGTRSSMLLVWADDVSKRRLLWADGPPCRTEYEDFTPLLTELSQRARYGSGETPMRAAI